MTQQTKLVTEEHPLVVLPQLAAEIGLEEAIVLQQIHYWIGKECGRLIDGVRWIFNRLDDWLEQFPWMTEYRLRKVIASLCGQELIEFAQHEKKQLKRRGWYTVKYEKLQDILSTLALDIAPRGATVHTSYTENSCSKTTLLENQQHRAVAISEKVVEEITQDESIEILRDAPRNDAEIEECQAWLTQEDDFPASPEREIFSEIRREAPDIPLNPQIRHLVRCHTIEEIRRAIAHYQEVVKKQGPRKNPPGWFTSCLRDRWWITDSLDVARSVVATEYPEPSAEQLEQLRSLGKIVKTVLPEPGYPEVTAVDTGSDVVVWWKVLCH